MPRPRSACRPPRSGRSTADTSPVGCARIALRNFAAISPSSSRSRFFEKVEWSHTASSTPNPTNQRNRQIELHPLHQLPFRANPIERLQQHRPKQLLRCNRRAAEVRVELVKIADRSLSAALAISRITRSGWSAANPSLQVHITEQRSRPLVTSAHRDLPSQIHPKGITIFTTLARDYFNNLLGLIND